MSYESYDLEIDGVHNKFTNLQKVAKQKLECLFSINIFIYEL